MDAERYARIRELFLAVDELPAEQQQSFLRHQCGDDSELYDEVISLLQEHDSESARLEGEAAKPPTLPATSESGGTSQTATSRSEKTAPESSPSDSSVSTRSPFLPAGTSSASGDSSTEKADSAMRARDEIKRRRSRESANLTPTDSAQPASSAQITQHISQRTHATPRYRNERRRAKRNASASVWQARVKRHRRFNSGWLWLAAVLPTVLIGYWTYAKVNESLRKATANELAGVADSVRVSVDRFLSDQARLTESWSRQVGLRHAVLSLLEIASQDDSVETLKSSPHSRSIREQMISVSQRPDIKYVVWDRTGRIIASWLKDGEDIGGSVSPDGAGNLMRAMHGETVLFGPEILQADASGFVPETNGPVMAEIMPIRDDQGRVVATMLIRGFGMFGDFDEIFRQASDAGGLDVYAVNAAGVMVTNSLAAMKRMTEPSTKPLPNNRAAPSSHPDTRGSQDGASDPRDWVACRLRVSDPAPTDTQTETLQLEPEKRRTQQLTYAAAGATSGIPGSRLDPYHNYAGDSVVGAWRWIGEWELGIVVERSAQTAFATASIVRLGFLSLVVMLSLTALAAAAGIAKRTAMAQAAVHPLSRYELISELGSGGMGVVYRARHLQLGRDTALKVLRSDRDNQEDRLRFDREAKLAASLSSPHTVTIYDYGRGDEGEAYCVMEFLRGITLYDVVARSGFQSYGRTLFILRQICDSLGEAHGLGLVHRDIKPQNVMLSLDASVGDWAVVFDFGLAKPLEPDGESYQTSETIWAGTPMYMAPERYRDPNTIDPRSDIYSVGCIAYFLLSGRPPFIECDPESLFALVLTEQPLSLEVHRDTNVPQEIEHLVKRCMAKQVDDRFASVEELAREIDCLIALYPWSVEEAKGWWKIHGEDLG